MSKKKDNNMVDLINELHQDNLEKKLIISLLESKDYEEILKNLIEDVENDSD